MPDETPEQKPGETPERKPDERPEQSDGAGSAPSAPAPAAAASSGSAAPRPFDWGMGAQLGETVRDPAAGAPRHEPVPGLPEPDLTTPAPAEPIVVFPWESTPPPVSALPEPRSAFGPAAPPVSAPPEPPQGPVAMASDAEIEPSPIDSLFGETQFKDYEGEPLIGPIPSELNPFASASSGAALGRAAGGDAIVGEAAGGGIGGAGAGNFGAGDGSSGTVPPARRDSRAIAPKSQRAMFWVAGAVIAALLLVLLFVLGTKIPQLAARAPAVATSPTPSRTPLVAPTAVPTGPAAVGEHKWSDLRGGECLDPYTGPFAENYTVVDCAAAHSAQMVLRGTFPAAVAPTATPAPSAGATDAGYPGIEALQAQINLLCTAPGVLNLAAAGAYSDIQFQAAYAANADEWKSGQHDYFCFVSRSGGEPITGSIAGTPAG